MKGPLRWNPKHRWDLCSLSACLDMDPPTMLHCQITAPSPSSVVIAIPVKDEERRIQYLLRSLDRAARRVNLPVTVVILVNNTSDRTVLRVREVERHLALHIALHDVTLPRELSNAGNARRLCMDLAAAHDSHAILMTTDADAVVGLDWISAAIAGLQNSDLVCGMIGCDDIGPSLCASASRIASAEERYAPLLHEVRFCLDRLQGRQSLAVQRPHYMESGAALAMDVRTYDAIGGLPPVACSEDRALVHLAERHGLRVGYSRAMSTWVSARLNGRAAGGMADCLATRRDVADPEADQAMLPLNILSTLWHDAIAGGQSPFPDRSIAMGARLRASDLEDALPDLEAFVTDVVRPTFVRKMADAS